MTETAIGNPAFHDRDDLYHHPEWIADCRRFWGRVLKGPHAHWCPEWDYLPIDSNCEEFEACTCSFKNNHLA